MLVVCSFSESHFLDGPDSRMGLKKRKNAGEGKKKKRRKKKKKKKDSEDFNEDDGALSDDEPAVHATNFVS